MATASTTNHGECAYCGVATPGAATCDFHRALADSMVRGARRAMERQNGRPNPPKGWVEAHDGSLACPHRDVSVCPACDAENIEACDVLGVHFWVPNAADRANLRVDQ